MAERAVLMQPQCPSAAHLKFHDLPAELLEQILLASPAMGMHVNLGAVCHEWRLTLTRRTSLCAMLPSSFPSRPLPDCVLVPALCAVLAQCPALASLEVPAELASEPFFGALERLDCAKSLRVLRVRGYVRRHSGRVVRVLSALPTLVELDVGDPSTFEATASDGLVGLSSLRVMSLCCPSDFPPARSFWASLSGLRGLRVGLPLSTPLTAPCRQLLADLREAVPRLEALGIYERSWRDALDGRDLIALLDGAASALRELSIHACCSIQAEFAAFVEQNLVGLEKINLNLRCQHDDGVSAMRTILAASVALCQFAVWWRSAWAGSVVRISSNGAAGPVSTLPRGCCHACAEVTRIMCLR